VKAPGATTAASVTSGSLLPTSKVGTYTLTLTATDVAGLAKSVTATYSVVYKLCYQYNTATTFALTGTDSMDVDVCDDANVNLSGTTHLEVSTKVDTSLTPSTNVVSGKSYGTQWYFNSTTKHYHYNLNNAKVTGLKAGAHQLVFTIDGVSDPGYVAPFTVK
jgi:hypothetical protein